MLFVTNDLRFAVTPIGSALRFANFDAVFTADVGRVRQQEECQYRRMEPECTNFRPLISRLPRSSRAMKPVISIKMNPTSAAASCSLRP
jgi:hypothetical protein